MRDIAKSYATRRRTIMSVPSESASRLARGERKRKNSLPKVLSTADRLIHFRINRFDQPGSHSGSLRRHFDYFSSSAGSLFPSFSRAHLPSRFFLPSARFLGGINNFYRPSGRRNGKRRWAFNLLRV